MKYMNMSGFFRLFIIHRVHFGSVDERGAASISTSSSSTPIPMSNMVTFDFDDEDGEPDDPDGIRSNQGDRLLITIKVQFMIPSLWTRY